MTLNLELDLYLLIQDLNLLINGPELDTLGLRERTPL